MKELLLKENQMTTRINYFKAADGKAEELYQFLLSLTDYIEGSDGCESYQVLRKNDDEHSIVVIEKWQSLTHHQQSVADFPKEEMQASMSLFAEPPRGNYYR